MTAGPMPLDAQLAKLGRILDDRIGLYRLTAKKQPAKLEEMSTKHAECDAIRRTFAWFVANADWIRAEAKLRQKRAEADAARAAEIADLSQHPAAAAVLDAFPGAEIAINDLESTEA